VAASLAERELHRRLVAQDMNAFAALCDSFSTAIFGVARRVTGDHYAAEDITQDTLLGLWARPERYDPDRGGLRPWLATLAHNRGVDWIRRERASRDRDGRSAALEEIVPDIAHSVEAQLTAERLRRGLAHLPWQERQAIELAYFFDKSYRQVAEHLDVPEGTIKSRIRSGLHRLSETLYQEAMTT
jgi:RNA polymerase sigma-70 factor (ECF subfamily)